MSTLQSCGTSVITYGNSESFDYLHNRVMGLGSAGLEANEPEVCNWRETIATIPFLLDAKENAAMPVKPIPDGYHTVTPYLMVKGAGQFIAFMATVFDAKVTEQLMQADGKIGHTELRIGDSLIMLSEVPDGRDSTPIMLHLYVEDVDAAFDRAVKAGGSVVAAPADQFYGDRSGGVIEPSGNTIWIATHVEDVSSAELQRRASARSHAPSAQE